MARIAAIFAALALAGMVSAQAPPPASRVQTPTTAPAANGYVGSNTCRVCHADVWLAFNRNPHYKSIASGSEPPEKTGCEGCHGPGQAHVAAGGGKTTIPHAFSLMQPREVLQDCLSCHARDFNRANIQRSQHTLNNVACTSCHSIHHSPTQKFLLAKQQREVCYGCHSTVRSQFAMPSKHRVEEGFMQCSDCHNPHGTFAPTWRMGQRPRMVEQVLPNEEACIKCHADKRGPFVYEHPPVRVEGCESCHYPHGSMNARLLKRPVVFTVCLECHNGGGTGTTGTGVVLQTPRHNLLDPKYQYCTTCHVKIHGSNNDQYFKR